MRDKTKASKTLVSYADPESGNSSHGVPNAETVDVLRKIEAGEGLVRYRSLDDLGAEFMLQTSEAAAIETLNAAPVITLDDQAYEDFTAALDTPAEPSARLRRHATQQPPWESRS